MSRTPGSPEPRLALIGFRYDDNSSFMKGAAEAPSQIRGALRSEAWHLTSESGIDLSNESTFFDAGDIEAVTGGDMFSLIENSTATLLSDRSRSNLTRRRSFNHLSDN
jgi:arginase family enzyme